MTATAAAQLEEVAPDAWDDLLAARGVPDVYFRRDYLEAAAVLEPGRPRYLRVAAEAGEVFFPCVLRPHKGGVDATSPMGYGGPVGAGSSPPLEAFHALYEHWSTENDVLTTFVRFHPLLRNDRSSKFHREPVAGSVSWRLAGELLTGMHAHHRRAVRKAERAPVQVAVEAAPAALDAFVALYEETMRRQGAGGYYFFPAEYWQRLLALGERLVLVEGRLGGELAAAVLCLASPPWLHYHLGASADAGRATGASHLLMLAAARWAQERGYEQFHLGAGVGGGGGPLLDWKRRFAPGELREQWIGKAIHNPGRYRRLTGTLSYDGFFPAYRRP